MVNSRGKTHFRPIPCLIIFSNDVILTHSREEEKMCESEHVNESISSFSIVVFEKKRNCGKNELFYKSKNQ